MLQCALTPALKTGDTATPAAHIGSAEAAAHLPRARDAAYWILQPLMSGLLDAMATVIVLDGEIGWRAVPAVVAAGLAAYVCCAHDRCKGALAPPDSPEAVNNPVRYAVFRAHAPAIRASYRAVALAMLVCIAALPARAVFMFGTATVAGMLYSAPVLPGGRSPRSLPFCKGPFCALVSTVVTVLVPAAALEAPPGRAGVLAAHAALRALAYEVLQDVPDAVGDARNGTLTLPVALGGDGACAVALALSLACGGAASAAGAPELLVVPAAFCALVGVHAATPKLFNRVAFKALSCIPHLVLASLIVS